MNNETIKIIAKEILVLVARQSRINYISDASYCVAWSDEVKEIGAEMGSIDAMIYETSNRIAIAIDDRINRLLTEGVIAPDFDFSPRSSLYPKIAKLLN